MGVWEVTLLSLDFSHLGPGLDPVWWHLPPAAWWPMGCPPRSSMGHGAEHHPQGRAGQLGSLQHPAMEAGGGSAVLGWSVDMVGPGGRLGEK